MTRFQCRVCCGDLKDGTSARLDGAGIGLVGFVWHEGLLSSREQRRDYVVLQFGINQL